LSVGAVFLAAAGDGCCCGFIEFGKGKTGNLWTFLGSSSASNGFTTGDPIKKEEGRTRNTLDVGHRGRDQREARS
jgi:hypothetical protein